MPSKDNRVDVAVVGAGVSGLAAAGKLVENGRRVLVLDKSRGVSGRVATRRWEATRVDHGAQFFTVRTRDFETRVGQWLDAGVCFRWSKGFHQFANGQLTPPSGTEAFPRYACRDGMSAIGKALAAGVPVQLNSKVTLVARENGLWRICCEDGYDVFANTLLLTPPAPQSLALIDQDVKLAENNFIESLSSVRYSPCLCVAAEYQAAEPHWKGVQFQNDPVLSWAGNDSSRRGSAACSSGSFVIILHAEAAFSERWQDGNLEEAGLRMLARAAETLGNWLATPQRYFIHRWRYAQVTSGYSETPFLKTQADPPAYAVGDAFMGARIEGAYLSGLAAANDILVRHAAE